MRLSTLLATDCSAASPSSRAWRKCQRDRFAREAPQSPPRRSFCCLLFSCHSLLSQNASGAGRSLARAFARDWAPLGAALMSSLELDAPAVKRRRLSKAERARRRRRHDIRVCFKHPRSRACRDARRHRKSVQTSTSRRKSKPKPTRRKSATSVGQARATATGDGGGAAGSWTAPTLPIVTARPPPVAAGGPASVGSGQTGAAASSAGGAPAASAAAASVAVPTIAPSAAAPVVLVTSSTPAFPLSDPLVGAASMSPPVGNDPNVYASALPATLTSQIDRVERIVHCGQSRSRRAGRRDSARAAGDIGVALSAEEETGARVVCRPRGWSTEPARTAVSPRIVPRQRPRHAVQHGPRHAAARPGRYP